MIGTMTPLFRKALLKADHVRVQLGLNMFQPLNIFDACHELGVSVRFVDISMEGMYTIQQNGTHPTILLSNQRPLPRRCFTCGHELGHHIFGHGVKIDALTDQTGHPEDYDEEELLVDAFAGALLMPVGGIQAAFIKRGWTPENSSPIEFYTICSTFGVGYHTLITHCRANRLISDVKATDLLKTKPIKIFRSLFLGSTESAYFKIIDKYAKLPVVDLEVSNYILLPPNTNVEGEHLQKKKITSAGTAYLALKPGIVRISTRDGSMGAFVRIQNYQYVGLSENRHLETLIG